MRDKSKKWRTKMANRKTILSLLDKMAVNYTEKISVSRAVAKLRRAVEKKELPVGLNDAEKAALEELGLIDEAPAKKKSTPKKKTAKKKSTPKKKTAKKPAKKKTATPKETTTRPDWMTVAANAVLKSKSMEDAGGLAADEYLSQGGKAPNNIEKKAQLYTTRASKALIAADVITVDDDGNISK
jgi:hypothetical protein